MAKPSTITMQTTPPISIILPVLNEATALAATLKALAPLRANGVEIIVVDGGSSDGSPDIAMPHVDRTIVAPRGRASQMNAGAAVARGRVLLFLHADTRLPENACRAILLGIASGRLWGRFDVRIEGKSTWLPLVALSMNWRSRLTGIATGDQAIFVSTEAFRAVGGFPDIPLMEDIALSRRLLQMGKPTCLDAAVATSGRRWETHGVLRTILFMWSLRLRYFFGADPHRLAAEYGRSSRRP